MWTITASRTRVLLQYGTRAVLCATGQVVWHTGWCSCENSSDIPAVTTTETDVTLVRLDPPLPQVDDGGAAWLGGARSGDRILAVSGGDLRSGQLAFT